MSDFIFYRFLNFLEMLGISTRRLIESVGYYFALLVESLAWIVLGSFHKQPVRIPSVFNQMMTIGIAACPIVFIL